MKQMIPQSVKNWYHLGQAIAANVWHGFPSRQIKVIGVTGTNGKTTTVQMITRILEENGQKVAMVSTINFKLGEKEWVNDTKYTTLSPFVVQRFLRQAVNAGCDYVVLETSSHSLDQFRVWGVEYRTAAVTNVTREHLDYHKTMEEYRRAKAKLFVAVQFAVINLDMEQPEEFVMAAGQAETVFGYTLKNPVFNQQALSERADQKFHEIKAYDINLALDHASFQIEGVKFSLHLPGEFNIENALAAIGVGLAERINLETMARALEKIGGIPGRLELVPNTHGLKVMIDYAVTPDSLEKLYALVDRIREPNGSVFAVFGACGERDRGKRPLMGKIVSRHADVILITNEDPYNEDPQQIIDEVAAGVKNKVRGENFFIIMDRQEAIRKALQMAKPGDLVIVTGKGAEETMAMGDQRIPWNDRQVIQEELGKL
ncbi:UDP-N-acetylmuramoyl-L-alanyl-D-glutamate--2,6-diaminopimelate ligase [Patescibacteria group bacterium]|nr:MAG: UDP-N-acetylmuramoyl-L-alanyl-D-glutamate--2,6-diaminopimelate ligase [Patescibacteria group bacterium]